MAVQMIIKNAETEDVYKRQDLALTGHHPGGQFGIPFTDIGLYVPSQGFLPKYCLLYTSTILWPKFWAITLNTAKLPTAVLRE